jgi:3-hydroxyisobutyrate dehydrogenase
MAQIAFIGLGNMGLPMARNLLKAGHAVHGFDVHEAGKAALVEAGGTAEATIAAAVSGAEVVVSMLPAGPHVREVYLGEGGVIAAARSGALLLDCSTIDVATAREVIAAAGARGLEMADSPVSGGVMGAAAGTLTFMLGGSETAFARAKPVLSGMGKTVIHAGGPGTGQAAKICNNMMLGVHMISLAEALLLAERLGLSAEKLYEISSVSSGASWSLLNDPPLPGLVPTAAANRGYVPGFSTAMMLKDLRLAQQAAQAVGATTPLGAEAYQLYNLFASNGNEGLDFSAIIKMMAGKAT